MKKLTSILLTLVLALGALLVIPLGASAAAGDAISATPIKLDTEATAVIPWRGTAYFSYTPTESGLYRFYSAYNGILDIDPVGRILDADGDELAYDDDSAGNLNFSVSYRLEAGKTYYFGASLLSDRLLTTRYPVFLTKVTATPIALDTPTDVAVPRGGEVLFSYTPAVSGMYRFYSSRTGTSITLPAGRILDANGDELAYDMGSGGGIDFGIINMNFSVSCYLKAGENYYFATKSYIEMSSTARYSVCLTKLKEITSIEVIDNAIPELIENIDGYSAWTDNDVEFFYYYYYYGDLTIKATFEDNSTVELNGYDFYRKTGYLLVPEDDQYDNPWGPGMHSCAVYLAEDENIRTNFTVKVKSFTEEMASAQVLSLGVQTTAVIPQDGGVTYFKFTPAESGSYRFYSSAARGLDPYVSLHGANGAWLGSDDDGGRNYNFSLVCDLTAGETYYFAAGFYYSDGTGSYPVCLEKYTPPGFFVRLLAFFQSIFDWLFNLFFWFL